MLEIECMFDGKVFIPFKTVDLPINQRVILHFEPVPFAGTARTPTPSGTPGSELLQFVGMIDADELKLISDAIEEGCEQVEPDGW